ncbi:DUF7852 domain-containing protein [Clostridium estertheticum]|uniref:DUF7852 domain-containing protein n=1 Tax=Clostridium estertheticum TaxID=238834 RepID=UPI001C7CAB62|nr:hypothetical protein [Clostridium estertheticum]MBX4267902.1 hypothetical protein [Clostridium estertheticum]WLC78132.1 hypothetical protein KTC98_12885 [Clostridium estertheticum]
MKSDNNNDKLGMVKLLIILNMLQQPNCIINVNKTSKKNSRNVKHKNKKLDNLIVKKNVKDKMDSELLLPIEQIIVEEDSELILPIEQVIVEEDSELVLPIEQVIIEEDSELILPIQEVTIKDDSKFITLICDRLSNEKIFIISKLIQRLYYSEMSNKILQNCLIDIKRENNVAANKLSLIRDSKDKLETTYILPTQEVIIKDDIEGIKKKDDSNITINGVYKIHENINNDYSETLISTLPIIIAQKNIDIPIESTFRLKNAALDIKNMKKDVYLTSSKLLPMFEKDDIFPSLNGKLFLEGFVRNKIDFSIAEGVYDNIINLDNECVIIYIPFKCTTIINCRVRPVFSKGKGLDYIPIYISSDCLNINNDFNEYLNEKNAQCSEYINCDITPINCNIERVKIYETYTLVDRKPFSKKFPFEMNFNTIKENILLNLSLTLIQKQDISINHRKNSR